MKERKLTRLAGFDYTSNRYYFFTVCLKDHTHTFGKIENRSMQLSYQGKIAMERWHWLGRQSPYVDLISFVIMPDHIHGIIHINAGHYKNYAGNGRDRCLCSIRPVPTSHYYLRQIFVLTKKS